MPTRVWSGVWRLERSHRRDQLQSRPHRTLGVILMGLRIAEINKYAVAHIFGDVAAKAAYGLGDAFLIGRDDLSQVLRVHAGRERRRADEVREHHCDLATLASVLGLRLRCGGRSWWYRSRAGKVADGRQHFPPMPEQDADVLEILIGQMAECRDIDPFSAKR